MSESDLTLVADLTREMARHAEESQRLSAQRRVVILRLRAARVTYATIAQAMGTSTQAVYKAIKDPLFAERVATLTTPEEEAT